jgi:hypothetical protein
MPTPSAGGSKPANTPRCPATAGDASSLLPTLRGFSPLPRTCLAAEIRTNRGVREPESLVSEAGKRINESYQNLVLLGQSSVSALGYAQELIFRRQGRLRAILVVSALSFVSCSGKIARKLPFPPGHVLHSHPSCIAFNRNLPAPPPATGSSSRSRAARVRPAGPGLQCPALHPLRHSLAPASQRPSRSRSA